MTDLTFSLVGESVPVREQTENKLDSNNPSPPSSSGSYSDAASDMEPREAIDDEADIRFQEQEAQRAVILTSLSNQLEYYFSQQNLAKDTYLETLRSLNDGCVPVGILANFQKVKAILPRIPDAIRTSLVVQAASEFSECLRAVYVDGQTSKMMKETEEIQPSSILAICTMDQQPLPSAPTASTRGAEDLTNSKTVILRDVSESIEEQDVRELFSFDGCPPVASLRQDVGRCWFVVLDAESPTLMIHVMEALQTRTLGGQPVRARRKASSTSAVPVDPAPLWLAPLPPKKKKKVRSKKKKKKSAANNANSESRETVVTAAENAMPKQTPPAMGEDDFPTLQENQVQWETPSELVANADDETDSDKSTKNDEDSVDLRKSVRTISDVASTATTTSSSTESTPRGKKSWGSGGYAAALMKQVPPAVNENKPASQPTPVTANIVSSMKELDVEGNIPAPVVNIPKARWGSTSSFASILRKDEELRKHAPP